MRSLPQKFLLVFSLLVFTALGVEAADQPTAELLFDVNKKVLAEKGNLFMDMLAVIFGQVEKSDAFSSISAVAVDAQDNIYITDTEKGRIVVLNKEGKVQAPLGEIGKGMLKNPLGVAVDSRGQVYVTDTALNKLFIFYKDGSLIHYVEGNGEETGKLLRPSGVLVDEVGQRIIVADTGNHRLQVFDLKGKFVSFVGKKGSGKNEFMFPTFLAKNSSGKIYVVDTINNRVQIFNDKFNFLGQFGKAGDILGYFGRPKGIAIDAKDNIFVSDSYFQVVSVFDKENTPLMFFGGSTDVKSNFYSPMGLAVNSDGNVLVADSQNKRVAAFKMVW